MTRSIIRRGAAPLLASIGLILTACSDGPSSGAPGCTPGATQLCHCGGTRRGVQVCAADGARWGPCQQCAGATDGGLANRDGGKPLAVDDGSASRRDASSDGRSVGDGPAAPEVKPIAIAVGHYLTYRSQLLRYRPLIVYGWAADPALSMYSREIQRLAGVRDARVTKMLMFSSATTLANKLGTAGHAAQLKAAGVTLLGYNTERGKTPSAEMANLPSAVARFSAIANKHGFKPIWGPIRFVVDRTTSSAYRQMFSRGLAGVALQEQKPIEQSCVANRVAAVKATVAKLRASAGGKSVHVQVQVMPSRCINGDTYAARYCGANPGRFGHCAAFARQIRPLVSSMAIWASSPWDNANLVALIAAMRK